jgi:hypothetical protein
MAKIVMTNKVKFDLDRDGKEPYQTELDFDSIFEKQKPLTNDIDLRNTYSASDISEDIEVTRLMLDKAIKDGEAEHKISELRSRVSELENERSRDDNRGNANRGHNAAGRVRSVRAQSGEDKDRGLQFREVHGEQVTLGIAAKEREGKTADELSEIHRNNARISNIIQDKSASVQTNERERTSVVEAGEPERLRGAFCDGSIP